MKEINLFYRNDAEHSDKVYTAEIVSVVGGFAVNFKYGKRGSKLAEGTKTNVPVSLILAEKVFTSLVREKTAKGYTEDSGGTPYDGDVGKLAGVLPHPKKTLVTLAEARQWSAGEYLVQIKADGVLARREVAGATLLGETVTARSGAYLTKRDRALIAAHNGSFFAAFTVEAVHGENILNRSTRERWGILCSYVGQFPPDVVLVEPATVPDKLTDEEGYVAHAWGDAWGNMLAVKQTGIYTCRVSSVGNKQSVGIVDAETGIDRGRLTLNGGACDRVRVGSIVRCEAMGEHGGGKLRQAVKCRDWLCSY